MERGALGVSGRIVVSPVALDFNGVIAAARDRRLAATPVQEAQWKPGTAIRIHVKLDFLGIRCRMSSEILTMSTSDFQDS